MSRHPHRRLLGRLGVVLLLPLLLVACGGLLSGPPERQLYRTDPTFATFPAGLPRSPAQLLVATPSAPAGLDTARIALSRTPVSLDYFADAEWTDRVPFLVQTALVEGFERSAALPGASSNSADLRADFVLETSVRDFEAVYDSPKGPPRIAVGLNIQLVRMPERNIVGHTAVRREATATANGIDDIVRAFDTALGGAAGDAVTWTVGNPALSQWR